MFTDRLFLNTLLIGMLVAGAAFAENDSGSLEHTIKVGPNIQYFNYDEPGVMEEYGFLYGVSGAFELVVVETVQVGIEGSLVGGELTYDGSVVLSDGRELPIKESTPNVIFNLRTTCGFALASGRSEIIFYSGLAYRLLVDDLAEASQEYGYTREQTYIYMPLGIRAYHPLNSSWALACSLEHDYLLDAENHSHGGALGRGVVLPQESGFGCRGACGLRSAAWPNGAISLDLFVEFWDIDDSEVVDGYMEPMNESWLFGLRGSVCFY